jgi:hypothetical protein
MDFGALFPNLRNLHIRTRHLYDTAKGQGAEIELAKNFIANLPRELEILEIFSVQKTFRFERSTWNLLPPTLTHLTLVSNNYSRDETTETPDRLHVFRLHLPRLRHLNFSSSACFDASSWSSPFDDALSKDPHSCPFPSDLETLIVSTIVPRMLVDITLPSSLTRLCFLCSRQQTMELDPDAPVEQYDLPNPSAMWCKILEKVKSMDRLKFFSFEPELRAKRRSSQDPSKLLLVPYLPRSITDFTINANWITQDVISQMKVRLPELLHLRLTIKDMLIPTLPGIIWDLPRLKTLSGPGTELTEESVASLPKSLTTFRGGFQSTKAVEALQNHLLQPILLTSNMYGTSYRGPLFPSSVSRVDGSVMGAFLARKWPVLVSSLSVELWSSSFTEEEVKELREGYKSITELDLSSGFIMDRSNRYQDEYKLAESRNRLSIRTFPPEHLSHMVNLKHLNLGSMRLSQTIILVESLPRDLLVLNLGSQIEEISGPPNLPRTLTSLSATSRVAMDLTRLTLPRAITDLDMLETSIAFQPALLSLPRLLVRARFLPEGGSWNDLNLLRFVSSKPCLIHLTLNMNSPVIITTTDDLPESQGDSAVRNAIQEIPREVHPDHQTEALSPTPTLELICSFKFK